MIALYVLTDPNDDWAMTASALSEAVGAVSDRLAIVVRHEPSAACDEFFAAMKDAGVSCFMKDRKNKPISDRDFIHVGALREGDVTPRCVFTASAHDVAEAARAKDAAAIFVGPIYEVPEKGPARGVAFLRDVRAALPHNKLYALGGIDDSKVAECIRAGADGVAVIRSVMHAKEPARAADSLVRAVDRAILDLWNRER